MKTNVLGVLFVALMSWSAQAAIVASCTYRDDRTGTQWLRESADGCAVACSAAHKACVEKAEKAEHCVKIKCLSNHPADQQAAVQDLSNELEQLAMIESQNQALHLQVAGGCGYFWNNDSQKNETLCQSNVKNGFMGALLGVLVGSFGGASGMAAGAVIGFGAGYALSYSKYGAD